MIEFDKSLTPKPKIIQAFVAGFNTTTNHLYLVIFPILLDLFLWFGPHINLFELVQPVLNQMVIIGSTSSPELSTLFQSYTSSLIELFEQYNLSSILRTIPIGVPSLLYGRLSLINPIGTPIQVKITSTVSLIVWILLFALVGVIIASLYYQKTASTVLTQLKKLSLLDFARLTLQIILIPLLILLIFLVISIPLSVIISIFSLINPQLGQFGLMLSAFFLIWVSIPLLFTPQSIFLFKQNLIPSVLSSISVVRYSLPGSAIFLLFSLLLTQGFNLLWNVPPDDSWMLLVGILGHAFISTAILTSTYHYFLDAAQYTQTIMNKLKQQEVASKM